MHRSYLLVALLAAGCVVAIAQESESAGAPDLPRHQILFARHSDEARRDYDIWRICADGTQMASLVVEPGDQFSVTVSPDGGEFVYASREEGRQDLWRRGFRGRSSVNLTDHPADDSEPTWSPDGESVAFFSDRDAEKPELYLLHLEEARIERLTEDHFHDAGAAWSPDGSAIVFTRYFPDPEKGEHAGDGEIIRLDLESRKEERLTELGGYNGSLTYSPDGETIAFHRAAEDRVEIWLMDADGANPRPITDTYIDEYSPAWSPDGNWIVFTAGTGSDGHGTFDLWLMRPDGSDRRLLSAAANTEMSPQWRPGEYYCR